VATLALALLVQASASAPASEKLDCKPGYEATLAALRQAPDARTGTPPPGAPFGVIEHSASRTLYTYTLPGAAGHPAIVRRQIVQRGGQVDLDMSACGWGDKTGFDTLMKQFHELNEQMKASLGK